LFYELESVATHTHFAGACVCVCVDEYNSTTDLVLLSVVPGFGVFSLLYKLLLATGSITLELLRSRNCKTPFLLLIKSHCH